MSDTCCTPVGSWSGRAGASRLLMPITSRLNCLLRKEHAKARLPRTSAVPGHAGRVRRWQGRPGRVFQAKGFGRGIGPVRVGEEWAARRHQLDLVRPQRRIGCFGQRRQPRSTRTSFARHVARWQMNACFRHLRSALRMKAAGRPEGGDLWHRGAPRTVAGKIAGATPIRRPAPAPLSLFLSVTIFL